LTLAPLFGTAITTTPTAFQLNNNAISQTGGGVIPLAAGVTGLYAGTGRVLHVAATGTIIGATASTTTIIVTLYEVPASVIAAGLTPTSFTGWHSMGASSTTTIGAHTACAFTYDTRVQLDTLGNLSGQYSAEIDNQLKIFAANTLVTGLVGEADLNFAVVLTLGGAEAGVIATLDEFRIDLE
jgi:hypothetical protein